MDYCGYHALKIVGRVLRHNFYIFNLVGVIQISGHFNNLSPFPRPGLAAAQLDMEGTLGVVVREQGTLRSICSPYSSN